MLTLLGDLLPLHWYLSACLRSSRASRFALFDRIWTAVIGRSTPLGWELGEELALEGSVDRGLVGRHRFTLIHDFVQGAPELALPARDQGDSDRDPSSAV